MLSNTIVVLSLLSGSALSLDVPDANLFPQMRPRGELEPRQTGLLPSGLPNLSPSCTSAIFGIVTSLPQPPTDLLNAPAFRNENPCSVSVPSSLSSDFSSYSSQIKSWYSDNSASLSSAFSQCPQLSSYTSVIPVCIAAITSNGSGGGGGGALVTGSGTNTGTATGTGTGAQASSTTGSSSTSSGSNSGSSSTSSTGTGTNTGTNTGTGTTTAASATNTGGAPRETGMAAAALAAAGFAAVLL